ncbi:MAG: energy transducer TonB [Janthinobacterium lividum]
MPVAPPRPTMLSRAAGLARAGARLPTSRTRRSRVLRRTLVASAIVHLVLLVLFVLMPRAPAPETAPDEPGIAMEFERPRPKGAASDAPQPHAGQGTEAPEPSRVQSDAPGTPGTAPPTPSPPSPEPSPLAPAPTAPDTPPPPTPPDTPPSAAQPLQQPPIPPPPNVAPSETAPPDAAALPDVPPADAPIAPVPAPAALAPPAPQPPAVTQAPSTQPAGQPTPAPTPSPVQAPAPEDPEADMQVNAGPLAELFNLQPIPVPQPRPPQPQPAAPAPRPRAARPEPAFPTPRQWAFTPAAPGGSPARGGSRGLNLSFAPQIHGGGGARSTPDFSAPDAGPDWENELHAWWDRHGYFPREAAEAGEQGTVGLHLVVNHDGRVTAARLTTQSGSVWLDQGALALFRDANLPPLPPQTSKSQIPVDLRIHYILH